jgi:hypothetical protein
VQKTLMALAVALHLAVGVAHGQQAKATPPPPKPANDQPNLETTMKFIQEKMNDRTVGYLTTDSRLNGVTFRNSMSEEVLADASTCTLHVKSTRLKQIEVADGAAYSESGKIVTGDNLHRELVITSTIPLPEVGLIKVEPLIDFVNRVNAAGGHPEAIIVTLSYIPPVYSLSLNAASKPFAFHGVTTVGKVPPQNYDVSASGISFAFVDEEAANRLAKAFVHAVELCGGGNRDPF